MNQRTHVRKARNPWVAALLSLLLPGLGELYSGQLRSAIRSFFGIWLAAGAALGMMIMFPFGRVSLVIGVLTLLGAYLWLCSRAYRTAREVGVTFEPEWFNTWYVYAALFIASALLSDLVLSTIRSSIQAYHIPSAAMEPTLLIGDHVWVSKRSSARFEPLRGALVVFESVDEPGVTIVKRVMGLPGDTLRMRDNVIVRNGVNVEEDYVSDAPGQEYADDDMRRWQIQHVVGVDPETYRPTTWTWGPLAVPSDSLFVLGDNRQNSYDSRFYGFVGRDRIVGVPSRIYYSYEPDSTTSLPFLTAVRWDRVGRRLP